MRDIRLNQQCASDVKELTMFPFDYIILLACVQVHGLMDTVMISIKQVKGVMDKLKVFV